MAGLADRWNRIKGELALQDLLLDVGGKACVALGLGALFARYLEPFAWILVVGGLVLSVMVKAKYWKRFWA